MTHAAHPFDALMDIAARPQAVFVRGEGAYLWDDSGKRYLDFMQGWAVNSLGHSPAIVADSLAAQGIVVVSVNYRMGRLRDQPFLLARPNPSG